MSNTQEQDLDAAPLGGAALWHKLNGFQPIQRLMFATYYVERLTHEARRHPIAGVQLKYLPLISEAVDTGWMCVETTETPDSQRFDVIDAHIDDYWVMARSGERSIDVFDPLISKLGLQVRGLVRLLANPDDSTGRSLASFYNLLQMSVAIVYEDHARARISEEEVLVDVVRRLTSLRDGYATRSVFSGIPEWPRGRVVSAYADGTRRGLEDAR